MGRANCGKVKYEGKLFPTKQSGNLEVLEYVSATEVTVRFIETGYTTKCRLANIMSGQIKDRLKPSVYGVGIVGEKYPLENGKQSKEYTVWVGMLDRCYSTANNTRKTYEGCEVTSSFRYFPFFKDWCHNQVGFGEKGFALDKDILVKGNKVYSPETCCFVPQEINNLLTNKKMGSKSIRSGVSFNKERGKYIVRFSKGSKTKNIGYFVTELEAFLAYKEAKEQQIKVVANRWKDQIDPRVYDALMNWEVDITD